MRLGRAAGRGDRPEAALQLPLERRHRAGLRRGHDRVGAGGVRAPGVLAQLQVPPAARPAHRELPRPRAASSRSATSRTCAARTGWPSRRHGRALPEHLAVAAASTSRRSTSWPAGSSAAGFYYKTFIRPQRLWPAVRARAAAVRARRARCRRTRRGPPSTSATPTPTCWSPAAGRPGWPPPWRPRRPARGSCWSRRSTGSAATCAGADERRPGRAGGAAATWSRPTPGHRGADQRGGGRAATTATGSRSARAARPAGRRPSGSSRRARRSLVVAPGLIERPYVFAGNDVPGVMLSTAVRRLINLYAVKPGERAVVLTANADGDAAVADLGPGRGRRGPGRRRPRGRGHRPGPRSRCGQTGASGRWRPRTATTIDCDLLVTATGWTAPTPCSTWPATGPATTRGRPGSSRRARLPDDVLATGGIAGDGSHEELIAHAAAVGREAARRAATIRRERQAAVPTRPNGPNGPGTTPVRRPSRSSRSTPIRSCSAPAPTGSWTSARTCRPRTSSRRCGRATTRSSWPSGTPRPRWARPRASSSGQRHRGRGRGHRRARIAETGTTTWRPPYAPVTLGALAGRRLRAGSVLTDAAVARGARRPPAGRRGLDPARSLRRPGGRGRERAEQRSASSTSPRSASSTCAVPTCRELLNLLYVNKWSKLGVGRVRYGVMCAEDGVVLDDGVTGRLGPEHYLMSTTSSGAADGVGVAGELAADRCTRTGGCTSPR